MQKDFDRWNKQKKITHKEKNRFYRERDIWWCVLGANVGYEEDGKGASYQRPVLVVRGLSRKTCVVLPLTTSQHDHPMRYKLGVVGSKQESSVILSQIRVVDTRRFTERLGILDKEVFQDIRKAVRNMF